MFELKFNTADFEAQAKRLGGALDQIPFALSLALNQAARKTKRVLVEDTWPRHVARRNAAFISRALQTEYATKHNLRVEIYDDLGRGNLTLHGAGGTRTDKGAIAIPAKVVKARRGARGVPDGLLPKNVPNSFKANLRGRGMAIWQRIAGKVPKLRLMYVIKGSASIRKDVPFADDFKAAMENELRESFPAAMARAMKGRRV